MHIAPEVLALCNMAAAITERLLNCIVVQSITINHTFLPGLSLLKTALCPYMLPKRLRLLHEGMLCYNHLRFYSTVPDHQHL